ncbi:MAG: hypothetical protein ACFB0F_10555, partial [Neomegalonema sp.]
PYYAPTSVALRVFTPGDPHAALTPAPSPVPPPPLNAEIDGEALDEITETETSALDLLREAAEKLRLTARGYRRILRVARTIADLEGAQRVSRTHVAEAASYRRAPISR